MDYKKIGLFIANERKKLGLTQAKLAEKIFVSEKTVSKWETGKGIPETNCLQKLCEVLNVSINELLNGERVSKEDYKEKAEKKLVELKNENEFLTKTALKCEIIIGVLGIIFGVSLILGASYLIEYTSHMVLAIVLMVLGVLVVVSICMLALFIEQRVGVYECKKCGAKFVPTYNQVTMAPHINRTRYMKCPHCDKKSWCKKKVN